MKIYSFVEQAQKAQKAQTVHNAAPVDNPFITRFQGAGFNPFRVLEQDTFARDSQPRGPIIPSFNEAFAWINAHNGEELAARLDGHLEAGGFENLRQAVGLLNAANKGRKLQFSGENGGQFGYHRNYADALDALQEYDSPAAKVYLQRARRCISGFQNLD